MWLCPLLSLCKLGPYAEKVPCFSLVVALNWFEILGGWGGVRREDAFRPLHSSLTHAADSFQCDMRASTSRCLPIKFEAAKFFAEMLGRHSTSISNLNWPYDPLEHWGGEGNQIAASHAFHLKKYQGLESHDFVNNDQMFLNPPFSQLKGGPHHKALSTLESISQLAERKEKEFNSWLI